MKAILADVRLIEEANFTASVKLTAVAALASLRYLKELAVELGIQIGDIQAAHVIADMKDLDSFASQRHGPNYEGFQSQYEISPQSRDVPVASKLTL